MIDSRDRTAAMYRIKNESAFIRKSLERTWRVASRVVIFDDGSTDDTLGEACRTSAQAGTPFDTRSSTIVHRSFQASGWCELHYVRSPYANDIVRPLERANEIRDRNALWYYMKSNVPFDHVLCLDGDEWLSLEAIRTWPKVAAAMDRGVDFVQLPFVYLWDGDGQQRIDGIYGPEVDGQGACLSCVGDAGAYEADRAGAAFGAPSVYYCASPRHKRLRFPRAFSIQRLTDEELYNTRVEWNGTRAGLHCGSIPQTGFTPGGRAPVVAFAEAAVVHAGYRDEAERQRKYEWYNRLDPGNVFEGEYRHVVGLPDQHALGPVRLASWEDV